MKTLYVYADFDWLNIPMLVGELGYELLRGSDSYAFKFDDEWLRHYGNLFLSADINNYPGQQYTQPGRDIFGCFSDALPDRWGRLLLNRREQILATEEKRPVRKLSSFDYLIGIDDFSRMGGFRFMLTPKGWTLSPAYDMNPTTNEYQSLLITSSTNKADLNLLLEASKEYMIGKEEAAKIIREVTDAVKGWRRIAAMLDIAKHEMDLFENRLG